MFARKTPRKTAATTPEIAPMDLELSLFISYSHVDRELVDRLVRDLRARGVRILVDQDEVRAGDSIRRRLETVMESTDVFLIAVSPDGVASGWVNEEMDLILERTIAEKAVAIPLIVRPVALSGFFRGKKAIDFTRYEGGLEELLVSLEAWDRRRRDRWLAVQIDAIEAARLKSRTAKSSKYAEVGSMALSMGRYAEAARILRQAAEIHPHNWDAQFLLSVALIKSDRFDEAEAILARALETGVQRARAHYNLACSLSRRAEADLEPDADRRRQLLASCREHLQRSLSLGLLSWLRRHAGRAYPADDVLRDPDLAFARGRDPDLARFLLDLGQQHRPQVKIEHRVYGGAGGCLAAGTAVTLAGGRRVPIESLRPGDSVLGVASGDRQQPARVWRKMHLWEDEGVVLNSRLVVTCRQPLWSGGRWRAAGSLQVGDTVAAAGGAEIAITTIERWSEPRPVYQLGLEGTPVFVAEGILVHNAKMLR